MKCLGVDGKRDKKTNQKEEEVHLVYTDEPGGEYLCHSEIENSTGRGLANDVLDVLAEQDSKESLDAIVADGTWTNTGSKEGMIAHVERDLQRYLLWLICQLHGNELGLHHVSTANDGGHGTSGPDSFEGHIGRGGPKSH